MRSHHVSSLGQTTGPFTTEQIYAMWQQGNLAADSLYFDETSQQWLPLMSVIESFKPLTKLQKLLAPPTGAESLQIHASTKRWWGYIWLSLGIGLLFGGALAFYSPEPTTITEQSSNPTVKLHPRLPGQISLAKVTFEDVTRPKTPEEMEQFRTMRIVGLGLGLLFLLVALQHFRSAKAVRDSLN
jgi:hypothetical protein